MPLSFWPSTTPPVPASSDSTLFLFVGRDIVLRANSLGFSALQIDAVPADFLEQSDVMYLGRWRDKHCFAATVESLENISLSDAKTYNLREVYGLVDEEFFFLAGRALQLLEWRATHRFCGRCGTKTEMVSGERATRCGACGLLFYPKICPAIITLVTKGDRVLLANAPHFPKGLYSAIAGFVEAGETLEQAVHREVFEEVGLRIGNIRYFGSQPWPFPNSLMLAFAADYVSGEIVVDGKEIAHADWFVRGALPLSPKGFSVSRKLIEAFEAEKL